MHNNMSPCVMAVALICGCVMASAKGQLSARPEARPDSVHVVVILTDGSRLIGKTSKTTFTLLTQSVGKVQVQLSKVSRLTFAKEHETATLEFFTGERLRGIVTFPVAKLETLYGEVSVPTRHITGITITPQKSSHEALSTRDDRNLDLTTFQVLSGKVDHSGDVLRLTTEAGVHKTIAPMQVGQQIELEASFSGNQDSINLMAGSDFAYHFDARRNARIIVQNTRQGHHWDSRKEERLRYQPLLHSGKSFTMKIIIEPEHLTVFLNDVQISSYRHRVAPQKIDGIRLGGRMTVHYIRIQGTSDT